MRVALSSSSCAWSTPAGAPPSLCRVTITPRSSSSCATIATVRSPVVSGSGHGSSAPGRLSPPAPWGASSCSASWWPSRLASTFRRATGGAVVVAAESAWSSERSLGSPAWSGLCGRFPLWRHDPFLACFFLSSSPRTTPNVGTKSNNRLCMISLFNALTAGNVYIFIWGVQRGNYIATQTID